MYAIEHNGQKAAEGTGYSKKTARVQASTLLTKPNIKARVKELEDEAFEALDITNAKIIAEYAKLAFSNAEEIFTWGEGITVNKEGQEIEIAKVYLKKFNEMSEETRAAIQSIEEMASGGLKIKLHDKKAALDSIAKIKGLFVDKHEHTGKDGGPIVTIIRGDDANL